jgi:acylphosphatase
MQIAGEYSVTGFVRNLPDGRVELLAEGEESEVREFLERVKESMSQHIRKAVESREPCTHEYNDFGIR